MAQTITAGEGALTQLVDQMERDLINASSADQSATSTAREARIGNIVRISVVKATAPLAGDPSAILAAATQVARGALRAVPESSETIFIAVGLAPGVARIENGAQQVRLAALNDLAADDSATVEDAAPVPAVRPALKRPPVESTQRQAAREKAHPNVTKAAETNDVPFAADPELRLSLGENTYFDLTAEVSTEFDSNLFLTPTDEVPETIVTVAPGISFRYGRSAVAGGDFSYQQSFVNYVDDAAPRASLGAGSTRFTYDNGMTNVSTALAYRQINQNNQATAGLGNEIIRRDIFDATLNAETELTAKVRIRGGASYDVTDYADTTLIGSRQFEVPVKFYFSMTPKTSFSAGASYRKVTPTGEDAGADSRDMFYNVGVRGEFVPKLTGEFYVGYRTRHAGDSPDEKLWGFDGSLNLQMTPKSTLSLLLARDFDTGVQGESLQGGRYTLRFTSSPTDQWTFGSSLSYFTAEYGPYVFLDTSIPVTTFRSDSYWEASLSTSYAFSRWFSTGADYSFQQNDSNVPTVVYTNNLLKLNMRFSY